MSDCGGVGDIKGYLKVNDTEAAAIGLAKGGVDINCGGTLTNNICTSIAEGLVAESVLDDSLHRSLTLLFDAGKCVCRTRGLFVVWCVAFGGMSFCLQL